jgi:hypothetical protein
MRARRHLSAVFPWAALVSVLGLALAGCGVTGPTGSLDRERQRLEQARAQWRSQGITDYQFTFRRSCFCAPAAREPALVTVRQGAIVSVESVSNGAPQDPALYFTIEGLFDLLEDAIDGDADQLTASYDSALGYPASAFIDRNFMIADEELGFQSTDLRPLRP